MKASTTQLTTAWFVSLLLLVTSGVAVLLLAGRMLSPLEYSAFIAFTAVSGVLVQGVGGAIEQHALLCLRLGHPNHSWSTFRLMGFSYLLVASVTCLPLGNWQQRAFEPVRMQVVFSILAGTPGLLMACHLRGRAAAVGDVKRVSNSIAMLSGCTLSFPVILKICGVSWPTALVTGQASAWGIPALYLGLRRRMDSHLPQVVNEQYDRDAPRFALLVVNNLLLLSALLSSQLVVKSTTRGISDDRVAQAQLIISVSCLCATLSVGLAPLILARLRTSVFSNAWHFLLRILFPGLVTSTLVLFLLVWQGELLTRIVLGDALVLGRTEIILLAIPGVLLAGAVLLNSFFVFSSKVSIAAIGWGVGLIAVWGPAMVSSSTNIHDVAIFIMIGTLALFTIHVFGLLIWHFRGSH